jgi:hypothetical protein
MEKEIKMNQSMNDLALLAVGMGAGLALALVAVMVYALYRTASAFSASVTSALARASDALATSKLSMDQLRGEVTLGLSRLDAERMYTTSLSLQRLVKSLTIQVDTLQKALFAQPAQPALDFTQTGMGLDDEAVEDAVRYTSPLRPPDDPLAGLTEAEKAVRVQQFFERRRQEQALTGQAAYATAGPGSVFGYSTPPAAGAGIYSSLLDEANQHPVPVPPPLDFSGLELEEGVEWMEKGELG